jgi:hypothetical protein
MHGSPALFSLPRAVRATWLLASCLHNPSSQKAWFRIGPRRMQIVPVAVWGNLLLTDDDYPPPPLCFCPSSLYRHKLWSPGLPQTQGSLVAVRSKGNKGNAGWQHGRQCEDQHCQWLGFDTATEISHPRHVGWLLRCVLHTRSTRSVCSRMRFCV